MLTGPETGNRGTPVFWDGAGAGQDLLYTVGTADVINAYQLHTSGTSLGQFNTTPTWDSNRKFGYPGATPSLTWSSGGSTADAILWVLDTNGFGHLDPISGNPVQATAAVLFAYKAASSGSGILPLQSTPLLTNMPGAVKFVAPTVVDGRIFIAGGSSGYTVTQGTCVAPPATPTCGQLTIFH
jgi:hypothetical protein